MENVKEKDCEHLTEMSGYNHNYYRLTTPVNDCGVVYQECCDCWGIQEVSLGIIEDGNYKPKFYLSPKYNADISTEEFDFAELSEKDNW